MIMDVGQDYAEVISLSGDDWNFVYPEDFDLDYKTELNQTALVYIGV